MRVVSIICTVKKFIKVAAADEVPFVSDDGTVVIAQRTLGSLSGPTRLGLFQAPVRRESPEHL
jgi:hypothetical protein